jgi:hypothetical protein
MPLLVRWYVRSALVYFAAGLLLGVLMAGGSTPGLTPVYFYLLLLGWISHLIMGIAL